MSDQIVKQPATKKWYLSKTLWTNFVMGVVAIAVPKVNEVLTPDVLAGIFMFVNMILRLVTKDKLQLK